MFFDEKFTNFYLDQLGRWRRKELADAEMACIFFFIQQYFHYGHRMAARLDQQSPKFSPDFIFDLNNYPELLDKYHFKNVKDKAKKALSSWLKSQFALTLLENIPSPYQVMLLQTKNSRPVTMVTRPQSWNRPVLTKKDALDFFLHDLEHASMFFGAYHQEQLHFNQQLLAAFDHGHFKELENTNFQPRLDYLLSDMNTHPQHSLIYMKSIWVDFYKESNSQHVETLIASKADEWNKLVSPSI